MHSRSKSDSNQKLYFYWLLVPHQDLPGGMRDRLIQTNTQVCKMYESGKLTFFFLGAHISIVRWPITDIPCINSAESSSFPPLCSVAAAT